MSLLLTNVLQVAASEQFGPNYLLVNMKMGEDEYSSVTLGAASLQLPLANRATAATREGVAIERITFSTFVNEPSDDSNTAAGS